jgi:DNA-binding MarR family transcriptional regulator
MSEDVRWLSPAEREAWLATAALTVALPSALDAQLQDEAGLSFFEYMVLAVLSEQPDRTMQMSEIAAFASGSLSRLSHTAKRLERQGYLVRTQVPGQGRRTNATLTDAGYAKVVETAPGHVEEVRRLLIDTVSAADLAALARIGRAVVDKLGGDCPPADPSGPAEV